MINKTRSIKPYHWPKATGTTPEQNIPLAEHADKINVNATLDLRKTRGKIRMQLRKSY